MPNIILYRNKCIGCGICYEQQPDLFRLSKKDGKATLVNATIKKDIALLNVSAAVKQLRELVKACPVKIIKLV